MSLPRRDFLKTTLAASAATAASAAGLRAANSNAGREYYDLRCYKVKPDGAAALDRYLESVFLPALAKRGVNTVGAFTEIAVDKAAVTATPKPGSPVWVLVAHPTLESFVDASADLNADPAVQQAGAEYLQAKRAQPAFDRVDAWMLRAFKSMPRLELPEFSKRRVPTRVFEMRDYESHSELKALAKMAMFDNGETELMRDLGMSPVFFGQALAGPNLPHLRYITSGPDLAAHLDAWKKFGSDPRWVAMKDLPQYADSVSKNTSIFLRPKPFSVI